MIGYETDRPVGHTLPILRSLQTQISSNLPSISSSTALTPDQSDHFHPYKIGRDTNKSENQ